MRRIRKRGRKIEKKRGKKKKKKKGKDRRGGEEMRKRREGEGKRKGKGRGKGKERRKDCMTAKYLSVIMVNGFSSLPFSYLTVVQNSTFWI